MNGAALLGAERPLRVVIAPDSFKGAATAREVANAIAAGLLRVTPELDVVTRPMADGGEGTVEALVDGTGGQIITETVTGPLGEPVSARYGLLGDGETAVIEMAAAAGLPLVPADRRDPRVTTTFGVGELVSRALDRGARRLILGIGGSATNDGGAGFAQALGARLLDAEGRPLPPGGAALSRLDRIDVAGLDPRLRQVRCLVACDVDNPLTGPRGAAAVFGPQKGATPATVAELDAALARFAAVVARDLGVEIGDRPGAGAAGGLGGGLLAFCNADLRPGVEIVIEATGLRTALVDADLVITGEGRLDGQTMSGKTPFGVLRAARQVRGADVPVILLGGSIGPGAETLYEHGATALVPIAPGPIALADAMAQTPRLLADAAERCLRLLLAGRRMGGPGPKSAGEVRGR